MPLVEVMSLLATKAVVNVHWPPEPSNTTLYISLSDAPVESIVSVPVDVKLIVSLEELKSALLSQEPEILYVLAPPEVSDPFIATSCVVKVSSPAIVKVSPERISIFSLS